MSSQNLGLHISLFIMKLFQLNLTILISTAFTDEFLKLVKIISPVTFYLFVIDKGRLYVFIVC